MADIRRRISANLHNLIIFSTSIGLIKKVSGTSGTLVNYSYLADGTKISALDEQGNGLEYRGSLTFRRNGSTRQVVETNDYYPFGKRWDSSSSVTSPDNRFRFNGKEDQAEFGTPYSDYGARQYSSFNGRWLTVDPLAEKYYSSSPYAFCGNNPVNFVDLDGRDTIYVFDTPYRPNDKGVYGSKGCITIHPDDAAAFFGNFKWNSGKHSGVSQGKIIVFRTLTPHKEKEYNRIKQR